MTHTAKELAWWKRFFNSIQFNPGHDLKIYADNQQAIRILTNSTPQFSTKLRHIDITKNWLRQEVQAFRRAEILARLQSEYPERRIAALKCVLGD